MSDSSTFRDIATDVATEAVDQPQETSQEPSVANEAPTETPQPEETFAEKGELKGRSPEELEETYQNWQKAYTAKRQKETQELKEAKQKLAELEQRFAQHPQPQGQGIEKRAQDAQRQVELGNMSVPEYTEYVQDLMAEKAREIAREEYQNIHKQEKDQQLALKAVEDFNNADPRLNEHTPEFDETFQAEVQREVADLVQKHLDEFNSYEGLDVITLTKQIIERRDKQLDEIIKKRTQQSTQAAKMRDAKAKKSEVRGTTSPSQRVGGDSIRSVLEDALDSAA
jgi:hypothetical protein